MIDVGRIRDLLKRVPRAPEDVIPVGASAAQCDDFDARTGITLPPDLREWVMISNGPCVGPGGLFGIGPARTDLDIETCLDLFPAWKKKKWIPIAGDGCGNYYIVPTQQEFGPGNPVLFIDTIWSTESAQFVVASGIGYFLLFLLEKELGKTGWPFDEQHVALLDPGIKLTCGVALPWRTD